MDETVKKNIEELVGANDVVLFMKGAAEAPMCGFSAQVVQILAHLGVTFKDINILEDETLRQGIKEFSDWPTIPQLYLKGEFIGGCDIVREMYLSGELQDELKNREISFASGQAA